MFFTKWRLFKREKKQPPTIRGYASMEKVYTPVNQLKVGMYIVELDRPWLETSFLFQGFELKNEAQIQAVKDVCDYVYIDLTKKSTQKSPLANTHQALKPETPLIHTSAPLKLSNFEKEIPRSQSIYRDTGRHVSEFMERIARGEGIDTKLAKEAVAECVNSILHSPDAILWLSQLKNRDEYTSQHSLNVCVLSIVLGRHINLSETQLNYVGLCGMMHDMGKMLVPLEVLNKPGKLEPEEMEVMQSHAKLGYELLQSSYDMYPGAIEVAYTHHERLDGQGYPRKINHSGLSLFTRIVTIVDIYDAITSDRVYQKGRTHLEATNVMVNCSGTQLDGDLVVKFIESIGVYPPGCIVEMTNGAVAIVVEVNEKTKLRPKIMLILNEDKDPVPEQVIDLSKMVEDSIGNVYTIKGIIRADQYGIDIGKYYQEGVLQKGFARSKG